MTYFERKILYPQQHESHAAFLERIQAYLLALPRPVVFTNGCFDILHRGHVTYLAQARALGASLIVGVNSDASVKRLGKGEDRPINTLYDRMTVLAALESTTFILPFEEDTPLNLILACHPEILVKGGDWDVSQIVGAQEVHEWGGHVYSIPIEHQRSTTAVIEKIKQSSRNTSK